MSVTSVNVTGILKLPSGQPAAFATVRFTLSNPGLLGITVVVPVSIRITADMNGAFSVALLPSVRHTYYTVTVFRSTGVVLLETVAVVPSYDCQFSQIIQPFPPTKQTAVIAALGDLQEAQADIKAAQQLVLSIALALESGDSQTLRVVASEALGGHRAVVLTESGRAVYADCTNTKHIGRLSGVTTGAGVANSVLSIIPFGLMTEPSWSWVPDAPVFLGLAGALTQSKPTNGFQQVVGISLSTTTLFINPREPIFIL